jgi:hypothetical protein
MILSTIHKTIKNNPISSAFVGNKRIRKKNRLTVFDTFILSKIKRITGLCRYSDMTLLVHVCKYYSGSDLIFDIFIFSMYNFISCDTVYALNYSTTCTNLLVQCNIFNNKNYIVLMTCPSYIYL